MKYLAAILLSFFIVSSTAAAPPDSRETSAKDSGAAAAHHRSHLVRRLPPETPADWVRQNSIALAGTDVTADDSELVPLKGWIHDVRVVGLGDGTHGTHEYYTVKKRLINFLAREEGINIVAFEAPWAEFNRINDYLLTGNGDPRQLLHINGYFFWEYQEMLDVLLWARSYNASRGDHPALRFVGVDTLPFGSKADVIAFFDEVDAQYATTVRTKYGCGAGTACLAAAKEVSQQLRDHRSQYEALSSPDRVSDVLQSARVVEEYLETPMAANPEERRDQFMAENLEYFLDRQGEDARAFFWAHNEHAGKNYWELSEDPAKNTTTRSVGHFLRDRFGDAYFVIGSSFLAGSFTAYDRSRMPATLTARPMENPTADNYESLFHQASVPRLLINLRTSTRPAWLTGPRLLQHGQADFGATKNGFNVAVDIASKFDAIVYLDFTTPAVPLP